MIQPSNCWPKLIFKKSFTLKPPWTVCFDQWSNPHTMDRSNSAVLSLRNWLQSICRTHNVGFIDNCFGTALPILRTMVLISTSCVVTYLRLICTTLYNPVCMTDYSHTYTRTCQLHTVCGLSTDTRPLPYYVIITKHSQNTPWNLNTW